MLKLVASFLGTFVLSSLQSLGAMGLLAWETFCCFFSGKFRFSLLCQQIINIGLTSQPVVLITGAFTGAVLEAQTLFQLKIFHLESAGGVIVAVGMFRELGPVITGLMIAGRVGSAMAAEIGTMKVSEQVDALRSMNVDPVDYLVKPRVQAMLISMPILMIEAVIVGIICAYIVALLAFDVEQTYWLVQMKKFLSLSDLYVALIKSVVFGLTIAIISCYQGITTKNGAVGVGLSTMRAMVYSAIALLIINFILTMITNQFFPIGLAK